MTTTTLTRQDIRYAEKYAARLCTRWGGYCDDEIEGAAREGLATAVIQFDPARSSNLRKYAEIHIKRAIVQYFRDNLAKRGHGESFKRLQAVGFHHNSLELSANGTEHRVIFRNLLDDLCRGSGDRRYYRLSGATIRRVRMRYGQGMTLNEISTEEKVSQACLSRQFAQIRRRAETILKNHHQRRAKWKSS